MNIVSQQLNERSHSEQSELWSRSYSWAGRPINVALSYSSFDGTSARTSGFQTECIALCRRIVLLYCFILLHLSLSFFENSFVSDFYISLYVLFDLVYTDVQHITTSVIVIIFETEYTGFYVQSSVTVYSHKRHSRVVPPAAIGLLRRRYGSSQFAVVQRNVDRWDGSQPCCQPTNQSTASTNQHHSRLLQSVLHSTPHIRNQGLERKGTSGPYLHF